MRLKDFVNSKKSFFDLLNKYGHNPNASTMFCPFHDDISSGHKSAKYYPSSDLIFCFSENRVYSSYDFIVRILGRSEKHLYEWAVFNGWIPSISNDKNRVVHNRISIPELVFIEYRLGLISFSEFLKHISVFNV